MNTKPFAIAPSLQAAFEAIKAKHQNIHACFAPRDQSLLLELADMLLLLSAQMALLEAQKGEPSQKSEAEGESLHPVPNPDDMIEESGFLARKSRLSQRFAPPGQTKLG